jgi:hypothetical protein
LELKQKSGSDPKLSTKMRKVRFLPFKCFAPLIAFEKLVSLLEISKSGL